MPTIDEVPTAHGPARVHWARGTAHVSSGLEADSQASSDGSRTPAGLVIMGPGASGSVAAPDLDSVIQVATARGWNAALVEPAYRVAGRRVPPRGPSVDEAWLTVVAHARRAVPQGTLVVGGRSFGGRVAARTAHDAHADAVLCLAFPLHPPGMPERSRLPELDAASPLPTFVLSGERDPFGRPAPAEHRVVEVIPGDHSLKRGLPHLRGALERWLASLEVPR